VGERVDVEDHVGKGFVFEGGVLKGDVNDFGVVHGRDGEDR